MTAAEQVLDFVGAFALLAGPFIVGLLCAFFFARFLGRKLKGVPTAIKVFLAGMAGVVAPVLYLWIWQTVDVALREARGDTSEYMGPLVWLIYGFPFFIISAILSFVLAYYGARRAR